MFEYDDPADPTVFSLNSFSKLLGPGLRLGWVTAHKKLLDRLLDCGALHSGGGFNPFTGGIVAQLFENKFIDDQISKVRAQYKENCLTLCEALNKYVVPALVEEEVKFTVPTGGFFCFVTLPERIDADKLLEVAKSRGVSYFVGKHSSPDKSKFKNCVRLCFAFLEQDAIVEGVKRLGQAVKAYDEVETS